MTTREPANIQCFVAVVSPSNNCEGSVATLSRNEGILSSDVAATSGCGLEASPWKLVTDVGRRIKLTLIDFSAPDVDLHVTSSYASCSEVAFVEDPVR